VALTRVCDMEVLRSVLSRANLSKMIRAVRERLYDVRRQADEENGCGCADAC